MKTAITIMIALLLLTGQAIGADLVTKTIAYHHEGVELHGFLAYTGDLKTRRPGILLVHEWWGLNDYVRGRAEQLARAGYVAFAVDMYGKGKVTDHTDEAAAWMKTVNSDVGLWRDRALSGLDVLSKQPGVDKDRIAAVGYCFGGATVQQLAYGGAPLKGIVSFHGPLIAPSAQEEQKVRAKILICHGAADEFVKKTSAFAYITQMDTTDLDWRMVVYSGAKHSFTNRAADKAKIDLLQYNASADLRSWQDMAQFFTEIFS